MTTKEAVRTMVEGLGLNPELAESITEAIEYQLVGRLKLYALDCDDNAAEAERLGSEASVLGWRKEAQAARKAAGIIV